MKIYKEANLGAGRVYTHQISMNLSIKFIAGIEETNLFDNDSI